MSAPVGFEEVRHALAAAVQEPDAAVSAWPDRHPGRWVTAKQLGQRLERSAVQIGHLLRELVEKGEITAAMPWPQGPSGYQPTAAGVSRARVADIEPAHGAHDERQWMLDALARWAAEHGGTAPSRTDWSKDRDPDRRWPRRSKVDEFVRREAEDAGLRLFVHERCDHCSCTTAHAAGPKCLGCFDCNGHCPHGTNGEWEGPSGWKYALQLAGLDVRHGGDHHATRAQALGRNRQLVTGGAADQHPQHFKR